MGEWIKRQRKIATWFIASFLLGAAFVAGGAYSYKLIFPSPVEAITPAKLASLDTAASAQIGPATIADTVKRVGSAVVNIETWVRTDRQNNNPFFNDPFFREFFSDHPNQSQTPEFQQQGIGSGFIISKDGYILTNEHVIHEANKIKVRVQGFKDPLDAKVIGADFDLDLAIIKIDAGRELPVLVMGDSNKTRVGDWVIAIGNPYGLDHTVTVGVISAKERPITVTSRQYQNLLQTDAAINPGNSGGPLINLDGEVIGINTAVNAQAQGIGFAIPTAVAKEVAVDLIKNGKIARPWVGVYLQPLTPELADYFNLKNKQGVLVADVVAGSPADGAGLKRGDLVIRMGNRQVKTPDDVVGQIKKSKIGDKLILEVYREAHSEFVTVIVGEKPAGGQ